jgi:hypothetical protein
MPRNKNLHWKGPFQLINAYIPPIRTTNGDQKQQQFNPESWPSSRRTLICPDANGHSHFWTTTPKKRTKLEKQSLTGLSITPSLPPTPAAPQESTRTLALELHQMSQSTTPIPTT